MRYITFCVPSGSVDWEYDSYIGRQVCSSCPGATMGEYIEDPTFVFDKDDKYRIKLVVYVDCNKLCGADSRICGGVF